MTHIERIDRDAALAALDRLKALPCVKESKFATDDANLVMSYIQQRDEPWGAEFDEDWEGEGEIDVYGEV